MIILRIVSGFEMFGELLGGPKEFIHVTDAQTIIDWSLVDIVKSLFEILEEGTYADAVEIIKLVFFEWFFSVVTF